MATYLRQYDQADGGAFLSDNKATYTLARDATTASSIEQGNGNTVHNSKISTTYYVRRWVEFFDTSSISTDTIGAASLCLTVLGAHGDDDTDSATLVEFLGANPAVVADFNDFGSTSGGTRTYASLSSTDGDVEYWDMNSTGIGWINTSGDTAVALRSQDDIDNNTPTGQNYLRVYQSSQAGTDKDPLFIVVHGSAGEGGMFAYPDPSVETTTVDGGVVLSYAVGAGVSWSTIRDATTGSTVEDSNASGLNAYIIHDTGSNNFRYLGRGVFLFDTSSITTSYEVDSATLSIQTHSTAIDNSPAQTYGITSITLASNTAIAVGDYDGVGTTLLSNEIAGSSLTISTYQNFVFNASGIADITVDGVSGYALRLKDDIDNTAPTWSSGAAAGFYQRSADYAGTESDPVLAVLYSTPAATTTTTPTLSLLGVG